MAIIEDKAKRVAVIIKEWFPGAEDVAQLEECSPRVHKALGSSLSDT